LASTYQIAHQLSRVSALEINSVNAISKHKEHAKFSETFDFTCLNIKIKPFVINPKIFIANEF